MDSELMQKVCLLGTAKMIRKVLYTLGCMLQFTIQDMPTIWIRSIRWEVKLK